MEEDFLYHNDFCKLPENEYTMESLTIEEAISSVNNSLFGFSYFKLDIDHEHILALEKIQISQYNSLITSFKNEFLHKNISDFMEGLSINNQQDLNKKTSDIIINITSKIINASGFRDSIILLRGNSDLWLNSEEIIKFYNTSKLGWHIDKTLEEMSYKGYVSESKQLNYLFTLKGSTTLYAKHDKAYHDIFIESTSETPVGFSCLNFKECSINDYVDSLPISSPLPMQGSVHIAGKLDGTIHASPGVIKERVVLLLSPERDDTIKRYLDNINKISDELIRSQN
jgi:hypothetical protein